MYQPKPLYKITASLLNSWQMIFDCEPEEELVTYDNFMRILRRERMAPKLDMLRVVDFIKQCENNKIKNISNIIVNGSFQNYVERDYIVDDMNVRVSGLLDVLKEGIIYDIKRVDDYELQDYYTDWKPSVYFALVPEAYEFRFLIASGYNDEYLDILTEKYTRDKAIHMRIVIKMFYNWLQDMKLFDVYKNNWQIDQKTKEK